MLPALRSDEQLRKNFFRHLRLLFYAGAGLSQPVWDAYRDLALQTCGERIIMVTGLGSTETAPMAIQTTWETDQAGVIGIPIPGVEAKLVPRGTKLEARVRGPNITPGYWRQPELTAQAFDADGFYNFGDALKFVDPADVNKGFLFDGRFSEDFKLASGTWASVGPAALAHPQPLRAIRARRSDHWPRPRRHRHVDFRRCRRLPRSLPATPSARASAADIFSHPQIRAHFQALLETCAANSTGSSTRVTRAIIAEEPPSLDAGEITDKGSLNQRAVLDRRAAIVEELYAPQSIPRILRIKDIKEH